MLFKFEPYNIFINTKIKMPTYVSNKNFATSACVFSCISSFRDVHLSMQEPMYTRCALTARFDCRLTLFFAESVVCGLPLFQTRFDVDMFIFKLCVTKNAHAPIFGITRRLDFNCCTQQANCNDCTE